MPPVGNIAQAAPITVGGQTLKKVSLAAIVAQYQNFFAQEMGGQAKANTLVRRALIEAGKFWIATFLPKRFQMDYARRHLGYRSTKSYDEYKAKNVGKTSSFTEDYAGFAPRGGMSHAVTIVGPQPTPYVFSGRSRTSVDGSAYPVASVTATKAILKVKIDIGNIRYRNADTFTKVPPHEYLAVVQYAERILRRDIEPDVIAGVAQGWLVGGANARSANEFQAREAETPFAVRSA